MIGYPRSARSRGTGEIAPSCFKFFLSVCAVKPPLKDRQEEEQKEHRRHRWTIKLCGQGEAASKATRK